MEGGQKYVDESTPESLKQNITKKTGLKLMIWEGMRWNEKQISFTLRKI